jgi:hypothetical protein
MCRSVACIVAHVRDATDRTGLPRGLVARTMTFLRFGPKGRLSPTLGDPCPVCRKRLAAGDYTTLVRRPLVGRYADDGTEVHWTCAMNLVANVQR